MTKLHPALHSIRFQQTFCMIKPDGVSRGLIGDIIYRIEKSGLKIVALRMVQASREQAQRHYPLEDQIWVDRLGEKSLSSFEKLSVSPMEILGTDDKRVVGKQVSSYLVDYLVSGPVVCMVIEGIQAIDMVRKLAGHTLPYKADVGTIRGDYSVDSPSIANAESRSIHNLIHASENEKEAANEIKIWFGDEKTHSYRRTGEDVMYEKYY
jgi:nucleoside-diphosphate kinase